MSDHNSADLIPLVSREQSGNAVCDALRLFVGVGRRYSVKQLTKASGVKERVIECAMCAPDNVDFRPLPEYALFSISKFLGPDFTNEWLGLTEQVAVHSEELCDDDMATSCAEYLLEYSKARHRGSEAGVELGPREKRALITKRVRLAA